MTKFLESHVSIKKTYFALLFFRIYLGLSMLAHGLPKFKLLFESNAQTFPDPLGIGNYLSVLLVVFAEVICSTLVAIGLFTRIAILPILIAMLVAVFVIHKNDNWAEQELAAFYLAAFFVVLVIGPGKYSIDRLLFSKK